MRLSVARRAKRSAIATDGTITAAALPAECDASVTLGAALSSGQCNIALLSAVRLGGQGLCDLPVPLRGEGP